jgi:hypothetical protein
MILFFYKKMEVLKRLSSAPGGTYDGDVVAWMDCSFIPMGARDNLLVNGNGNARRGQFQFKGHTRNGLRLDLSFLVVDGHLHDYL